MEIVTVVNRIKPDQPLPATWDGKHYTIPPGKSAWNHQIARAAKMQNPIKGSDDPLTGNLEYYIGIEEEGDDCSPVAFSQEIELYRSLRDKAVPVIVIPGKQGMFNESRLPSLPISEFTDPNR